MVVLVFNSEISNSSAAFCPISKPGCLIVLIEGVTNSEKGSLLKPTIKISWGTFMPMVRK